MKGLREIRKQRKLNQQKVAMDLNNVTNEIDPQEIVDKIQGLFD